MDDEHTRRLVEALWSYQVGGLDGLMSFLRSADADPAVARSPRAYTMGPVCGTRRHEHEQTAREAAPNTNSAPAPD